MLTVIDGDCFFFAFTLTITKVNELDVNNTLHDFMLK